MPKYVNKFGSPEYVEETILDGDDKTLGTIRIKPSSVLWKPVNAQKFYSISMDDFVAWITNAKTGATKTKK